MTQFESVLLVEDDETSRFLATSVLKKMGVGKRIVIAVNGLEALNLLKEVCANNKCPELIILDIKMPVMDGFELLAALNQAEDIDISQAKVIMLSSSASPKDMEKAQLYPFITYMHKPLTKEKLQEVLIN